MYFSGLSLSYLWLYFANPMAPLRHEYMEGVILGLFISLPFWLLASGLLFPARRVVSRRVFIALNTPSVVLGVGFLLLNLYALFMAMAS